MPRPRSLPKSFRNRPLDEIYPIVYLDGIVIKVRQDKQIIKKTMYIASSASSASSSLID
jgi:transposase-like protein